MKDCKLKAFTMIELLVAMVLSGVIISFCYLAYAMVQKNYTGFRSSASLINESVKLQSLLFFDVNNCKLLTGTEKELLFLFEKNKSVKYLFHERSVVRMDGEVKDTLQGEVRNMSLKYNQKEVSGGADPIIDEISFTCNLKGEEEVFSYFKSYPADVLLKQDSVN